MDAKENDKISGRKYNESCLKAYFLSDGQKALIFFLGLSMVIFGSPENAHVLAHMVRLAISF